jgi:hypothetical protein
VVGMREIRQLSNSNISGRYFRDNIRLYYLLSILLGINVSV